MNSVSSLIWSALPFSIGLILTTWISFKGKSKANHSIPWVDSMLFCSLFYQLVVLACYTYTRGSWPLESLAEVLLLCSWLIALGQWISHRFAPTTSLAFLALIPALMSLLGAYLVGDITWAEQYRNSILFQFHIALSTFASAFLSVGVALSLMFILLESRLRRKKFDHLFHRLPPLQKVESMSFMWTLGGGILCLLALIFGYYWKINSGSQMSAHAWLGSLFPIIIYTLTLLAYIKGIRGRVFAYSLWTAMALFILSVAGKIV